MRVYIVHTYIEMILFVDLKGSVNSIESVPLKDNEDTLIPQCYHIVFGRCHGDGVFLFVTRQNKTSGCLAIRVNSVEVRNNIVAKFWKVLQEM